MSSGRRMVTIPSFSKGNILGLSTSTPLHQLQELQFVIHNEHFCGPGSNWHTVSLFPSEVEYHRKENTDFVQSIPGFQECDEDVETWMICDEEDSVFQLLNDDETVTSVQEKSDPVDDETDEDKNNNNDGSSRCSSNADAFSALEIAMEWYEK
ncbi:hypothetical protein TNCV_2086891 [Trichonephila clavipes]|nr:hypothetical protein TNCV_2086891 [Trichonephila clavipes]